MATKASIILSAVDRATGPIRRVGRAYAAMSKQSKATATRAGQTAARIGTAITAVSVGLAGISLKKSGDVESALGELASVGVTKLGQVREAARQFSNQWINASAPEFIRAAYDIKSGISSLSDEGVAGYTKFAGVTAMATKATIGDMTSLFATGFGIFRKLYAGMSDLEFGKVLSAGIASSVQRFKTTGEKVKQSIESLGSVATENNVPLAEQLAILGQLQAVMSGAEAGTKYKSYLQGITEAGQRLGLPFLDANRQIKSMDDVLAMLRQRFGETLDAAEQLKLKKAFGRKEAVDLILNLWSKTDQLRDGIQGLSTDLEGGLSKALEMARVQNEGMNEETERTGKRLSNLAAVIGGVLTPAVLPFMQKLGGLLVRMQEFAAEHPGLVKNIFVLATTLGVLTAAIGTATAALFAFNVVAWTNPVTWIIVGIMALIAAITALVVYWDEFAAWFMGYWQRLTEAPRKAWADIRAGLGKDLAAMGELWDKFCAWLDGYWQRLTEAPAKAWADIKKNLAKDLAWIAEQARSMLDWLPDWAQAKLGIKVKAEGAPGATPAAQVRTRVEDLRPQPQTSKVGGRIDVNFKNAPAGMRVEHVESTGDSAVGINTGLTLAQPWI